MSSTLRQNDEYPNFRLYTRYIWKLAFLSRTCKISSSSNFQNFIFPTPSRVLCSLNYHPRSSSTSTHRSLAEFLGYFNFTYNLSLYFSLLNTLTLSLDIILFPHSQITHPSLFFAYVEHTLFSLHLSSSLPCYFHRVFKLFLNFLR